MYSSAVGEHWHRYCQPAQVCQGREAYYWALFPLPKHYFDGPLFSYAQFLQEQHTPA
jgi:hypothetical protein